MVILSTNNLKSLPQQK